MSNLNINNQLENACNKLLNLIPKTEFYIGILTRSNILNLYDKYNKLINDLPLNENQVFRCLLHNFLRYINMSIQNLDILLVIGLKNITILDMKSDIKQLITTLVNENLDSTDNYIIERILSQINNNLPHDVRIKFTPTHKHNIIKLLNNYIPFKDNLEFLKNDKKQFDFNKYYITKYGTEQFTSLDNNFLNEMDNKFQGDIPSPNDYNNLINKGYELNDYLKYIKMEIDEGTYEEQLKKFLNTTAEMKTIVENNNNKETSDSKLLAMYIDKNPELHFSPLDNKFYFYEHASGSLIDANNAKSLLNLDIDANNPKLSIAQKKLFEKTLKEYNLPRDKVDNAVKFIETVEVEEEIDNKLFDSINNLKVDVESEQDYIHDKSKHDIVFYWFKIILIISVCILLILAVYLEYKYSSISLLFNNSRNNNTYYSNNTYYRLNRNNTKQYSSVENTNSSTIKGSNTNSNGIKSRSDMNNRNQKSLTLNNLKSIIKNSINKNNNPKNNNSNFRKIK